jgi:hypothetical protein
VQYGLHSVVKAICGSLFLSVVALAFVFVRTLPGKKGAADGGSQQGDGNETCVCLHGDLLG